MKNKIRLINTEKGHNKFYEIEPLESDPSKVLITYGRIEWQSSATKLIKPKSYGDIKYREKLAKGYIDVSHTLNKISLDDIFSDLDLLEKLFNAEKIS